MTMPGLGKVPSAEKIDVDASGKISGLFLTHSLFLRVDGNPRDKNHIFFMSKQLTKTRVSIKISNGVKETSRRLLNRLFKNAWAFHDGGFSRENLAVSGSRIVSFDGGDIFSRSRISPDCIIVPGFADASRSVQSWHFCIRKAFQAVRWLRQGEAAPRCAPCPICSLRPTASKI